MKQLSFITIIMFALLSCHNANNTNKTFATHDPNSRSYKEELAKQIANDGDGLTYTFNKCLTINGRPYLDITFSGRNINAKGLVLVNNWNKLNDLKRTNGKGYSGAELKNLKLDIINSNAGPSFIYKDLDAIID